MPASERCLSRLPTGGAGFAMVTRHCEAVSASLASLTPDLGNNPRTSGRCGRDPRVKQGDIAAPIGGGHFIKMIHIGDRQEQQQHAVPARQNAPDIVKPKAGGS